MAPDFNQIEDSELVGSDPIEVKTFAIKVDIKEIDVTLPGDDDAHWLGGFPLTVNM